MGKKKKNAKLEIYPLALTIAGSDSGGGAGIQADLRTFSAFGVYGTSVITAVTSQNPCELTRVDGLPKEAISSQLEAVSRLGIKAIKTGMLLNSEIIDAIVEKVTLCDFNIVVDPVMISTSGAKLLDDSAVDSLMNKLLPIATWITPNIPEAVQLTNSKIETFDDMIEAAKIIAERWDCNCVVKGGHLPSNDDLMSDAVVYQGNSYILSSPTIEDCKATHGTGCTFSSAMAASIALEFDWSDSLLAAKSFVFGSLNEAVSIADDIVAMYPPSYSYDDSVSLELYEK